VSGEQDNLQPFKHLTILYSQLTKRINRSPFTTYDSLKQ